MGVKISNFGSRLCAFYMCIFLICEGFFWDVGAFRWQSTWDNPSFRKEGQGILVCLVGLAICSWITRRELGLSLDEIAFCENKMGNMC